MQTKSIAIIIMFATLAIALNPIRIPTLISGFNHRVYEIPIVIAFFLFGFKIGFSVQILHLIAQISLFPGSKGGLGYITGLLAVLVMVIGILVAKSIINRDVFRKNRWAGPKAIILFTSLGTLFRGTISPILDYIFLFNLFVPLTIGSLSQDQILALMPGVFLFNIVVPLYTIPISYFIAKRIKRNLNMLDINEKSLLL
jgi:riboflavin transporter FmnP